MSKSAKSKNATLKKVKKLERQGKYLKALKVCDEYLDNAIAEENLILLKIDILVEYYNNDEFIGLINEYKIKLTHFLEDFEEIELLKIYNTLDNYLELKTQNLASEGIVKSYLAGGLLIDNLETILVLNEMVKDNYENIKNDAEFIESKVPHELESFVENVSKTSYQYLELILENPKEQISNSNFDLEKIRAKLRKFLEPKKDDEEEIAATTETSEEIIEMEEVEEVRKVEETVVEEVVEPVLEAPIDEAINFIDQFLNETRIDKEEPVEEEPVVVKADIGSTEVEEPKKTQGHSDVILSKLNEIKNAKIIDDEKHESIEKQIANQKYPKPESKIESTPKEEINSKVESIPKQEINSKHESNNKSEFPDVNQLYNQDEQFIDLDKLDNNYEDDYYNQVNFEVDPFEVDNLIKRGKESETTTIIMCNDVGEIMGVDEKVYGPFHSQDVVVLPKLNAKIFLDTNQARLVNL